ncbi:hypothetical protein [Sphingomonas sp. VNH70]|uniref:hypothetical protein n=1 Tax=Sphingomonas silueang TaxID=3156617 RepID=UPI0032B50164
MSDARCKFSWGDAFSRRSMARELVGTIEILIIGTALYWLCTSAAGKHLWVWMAVGLPLNFAYIFVGGYVRHHLGLIGDDNDR